LVSSEDLNLAELRQNRGFNFATTAKFIITALFLGYFYSLFFGESAIGVLIDAKDREVKLVQEYNKIQNENQKLQKKHFELIQLTPQEDSF